MEKNLVLELHEKARRLERRIVLPEAQDPRVRQAATLLSQQKICRPVLVDTGKLGAPPAGVEAVNPARDARTPKFAAELFELRKAKGMTLEEAKKKVLEPLFFGGSQDRGRRPGTENVASAIWTPVRPGMSYTMTGVSSAAAATAFTCATMPACGGLL